MKAFAIAAHGKPLQAVTLPDPDPGPGEVRVRLCAAAVNPADPKVMAGGMTARVLHGRRFPLVVGYDFSGVIDRVGPGVELPVEQAVFGHLPYGTGTERGSFAEYVVTRADRLAVKPDAVGHLEAAATATTGCTALQGLRDVGGLEAGMRALVNGASGGVGTHAVQIARLLGAEVTGTCSAAKVDYVKGLGADRVVDYRAVEIAALGETYDVVFDAAAASSYRACRSVMADGGVYVTTLPEPKLLLDKLAALFSARSARFVAVAPKAADLTQLAAWLEADALRTPLDATFAFDALPDAIARLESGEVRGKVAIDFNRAS